MPLGPGVIEVLETLVDMLPDGASVVELGSHEGYSARKIADIILPKGGTLFCVDPYQGECPDYEGKRRTSSLNTFVDAFTPNERVILVNGFSFDVAPYLINESFDMVFIDADHRYSHVKRDLRDWWPKLKRGGIMCGDDYEGPEWDESCIEKDMVVGEKGGHAHHGLAKAVVERFGDKLNAEARCWFVGKDLNWESVSRRIC